MKPTKQRLYAIKSPIGVLLWDTTDYSRSGAWSIAYHKHLYKAYAYCERPTKAAYANGWRCVPVRVSEIR